MMRAGEEKIQFWTLLGPVFLLLTLSLTLVNHSVANYDVWVIAVLGIAGIWKWKNKAFLAVLGAIAISSIYKHATISSYQFWQLGVEFSLLLGFCITSLSFDQVALYFQKFEENKEKFLEEIDTMKKDLFKEKDFHTRQEKALRKELEEYFWKLEEKKEEKQSMQSLLDTLRKNLDEQKGNRDALIGEIQRLEKKLAIASDDKQSLQEDISSLQNDSNLKRQNEEMLDELNRLRLEKNQLQLSLNSMQGKSPTVTVSDPDLENRYEKTKIHLNQLSKKYQKLLEDLKKMQKRSNIDVSKDKFVGLSEEEKQSTLVQYEKKLKQLQETENLYKQMKKQFDEKSQALKQAKFQLKKLQEERHSKFHEKKHYHEAISPREYKLAQKLEEAEKQVNHFQNENQKLESIVSELS